MRMTIALLASASLVACSSDAAEDAAIEGADVEAAALTFEGADTGEDEAARIAHGERLSSVLLCKGCHTETLTGIDMGEFEPELKGVIASNLTRTVPKLDDSQLEKLLREGIHPAREQMWVMPSRIFQHVSDADMAALIAYLRTLEPAGEDLPLTELNEGLAAARAEGKFKTSQEEVADYAANQPADLGESHALGRYIATTVCADCHGATLRGESEFGPDLAMMGTMYDEAALGKLLTTGEGLEGRELGLMAFIGGQLQSKLTEKERGAVAAYVRALAEKEAGQPQ